jgi:membrane protease YdiL (CAAX protease family)
MVPIIQTDVAGPRASRELLAYFAAAFSVSWLGVLLIAARTGLPAPVGVADRYRPVVFLAMLAGPSIASLGLTSWSRGVEGLRELMGRLLRWRVGARWYGALLIAPLALVLTLGILSLGSAAYVPPILSGASPASVLVTALIAGLGAGFFEELGWTGFATPRLLGRYGWRRAGLLLGVVWATWHGLPDSWGGIGYGSLWSLHFLEWYVALGAFRMLMTWIYSHTGSVLVGILLHATFTGGQVLLWPPASAMQELVWYGLFASALWAVVAVVGLRGRPL